MAKDYEALEQMLASIHKARAEKQRRNQDFSQWHNTLVQNWQMEMRDILTHANQLFNPLAITIHGTDLGRPNSLIGKLFVRMSHHQPFADPESVPEIHPLEFTLEESGMVRVTSANEGARLDFLSIESAFPHEEVCQIIADHIGAALRKRDGL